MKKLRDLLLQAKRGFFVLTIGALVFGLGLMPISIPFALATDSTTPSTPSATTDTGPIDSDDMFGDLSTGDDFASISGLGNQDLATTIASIIRVMLGFLGVVAVCLIIFGGFKWMIAGGKEEQVKKAQNLIIYGVIGIIIVLAAYAIASFVLDSITTAVSGS
ncbi:hypothetical protein CO172_02775 [Candidatus Uhrbacteria bacterium CG_4_9_14_3_um_filter_36_7]|uniref:Uncharacterized protein n=1 Tax=Candidatus Uhrbacteria bacterium CG_4_9_14_3_um_filter_36_7 TaxID=1975033 RepID=A0A2M7XH66_9BACT|nr:MAG: hypothetical protein CO172_02775 [Candidatus Uhrbacteria bacterium CG_4_9_14_3_um_filter_36_7]